jgi:hypothetical protein
MEMIDLSRQRPKRQRIEPKAVSESKPKTIWKWASWLATHFTTGHVIALVSLGVAFLLTATFGTVTNDDMAALAILDAPRSKGQVILRYRPPPGFALLPALFTIERLSHGGIKVYPTCMYNVPEEQTVDTSSVRISNRLGKTMQVVLSTMEWLGISLRYTFSNESRDYGQSGPRPKFWTANL